MLLPYASEAFRQNRFDMCLDTTSRREKGKRQIVLPHLFFAESGKSTAERDLPDNNPHQMCPANILNVTGHPAPRNVSMEAALISQRRGNAVGQFHLQGL